MGLPNSLSVVGVYDEDEPLRVLEVMSPEWPDLVLATDVPHGEADVLVFHGLHVEPNGRDCRDDLAQLELVQNGRFSGGVQPN